LPTNTLKALKKHADRYGYDGVMETAVDLGLNEEQLIELQEHIDEIVSRDRWAPKRRLSAETRVRRLLGVEESEDAA